MAAQPLTHARDTRGRHGARRSTRASERPLSLRHSLSVSWFYPSDFGPGPVSVEDGVLRVVGESEQLLFLDSAENDGRLGAIREHRWARAQISDNAALAPGFIKGIRFVVERDGDLVLQDLIDARRARTAALPPRIVHVALVLRRCPEHLSLRSLLLRDEQRARLKVQDLARMLAAFHKRSRRRLRASVVSELSIVAPFARRRIFRETLTAELPLEAPLNLAAQEVRAALRSFCARDPEIFERRARNGLLIPIHGDLRVDNVCLRRFAARGPSLSIFSRVTRDSDWRWNDVLVDVASMIVDLESAGAMKAAVAFRDAYFRALPEAADPELLRFYVMFLGLTRAAQELSGTESSIDRAPRFCALALRSALKLTAPFAVFFREPRDPIARDAVRRAAATIADMSASCLIQAAAEPASFFLAEPPELAFDRVRDRARSRLLAGDSVIVLGPSGPEPILSLERDVLATGAQLFVPPSQTVESAGLATGHEPIVPLPLVSLMVLQDISQGSAR